MDEESDLQDKYSIEDLKPAPGKTKANAKFEMVKCYLEGASQAKSPDSWFLNFSSCTEYMASPESYANIINPQLYHYLVTRGPAQPDCGFGTILMDFVTIELIKMVILAN